MSQAESTEEADLRSFEDWYRQEHSRLLAAMAVAARDLDVAADVVGEAFSRAYERWERVGVMASPGGWTYRVALNLLRRRLRRQALEDRLWRRQVAPASIASPECSTEVWDAVSALPRRQRTAVALRYVLDLPEAEVARAMGVTRGTVARTLADARQRLARCLDPDDAPEWRFGHA